MYKRKELWMFAEKTVCADSAVCKKNNVMNTFRQKCDYYDLSIKFSFSIGVDLQDEDESVKFFKIMEGFLFFRLNGDFLWGFFQE